MELYKNFLLQWAFIQTLFILCLTSDEFCTKNDATVCTGIAKSNSLRFFILGDWGGKSRYPYTSKTQLKVAKTLDTVDKYKDVHFYLSTGDNFYEKGVKNVDDSRFQTTYEDVYNRKSHQKPWYFVAGNHDYNGNVSAQVDYSNKSSRWNFPSNFYTITYAIKQESFSADFVMIDTVRMCGHEMDDAIDQNNDLHPDINSSYEAFDWIKKALKQSKAQYLFVVGHYPVTSAGFHGPNRCLYRKLLPLLQQFNASAYICGHDHNLQHLIIPGKLPDLDMNFVLSGSGSKYDTHIRSSESIKPAELQYFYPKKSRNRYYSSKKDKGGFVYCNLTKKVGKFIYYDIEGNDLYSYNVKSREY